MPRILHFAETLVGGPASYLEEIASHQVETFGAENVRFLIPEDHRSHVPSIPDELLLTVPWSSRDPSSLMRIGVRAARVAARFQPDLIHLHSTFAGGLGRLPLLLRAKRPAVVYCAHGWAFLRDGSIIGRRAIAAAEWVLARATDRIVNISDAEARGARHWGMPEAKLVTIRNGINSDLPPSRPTQLDGSRLNLLFVGRHDPQKGLDILLYAMARLVDEPIHLHVVGEAVVSKGSKASFAQPNVSYYGWLPRSRVFDLIAGADAVVVPSRWEGFGLIAIEAMRMGKPVVASDRGALPEIVANGVTGHVVRIDDTAHIVETLRSLTRVQLERMGRAARARFLDHFTSARMNQELIALYDELLTGARLPRAAKQEPVPATLARS
jgi:glycosyltransferase involved in cell wall biosynthesis